MITRLRSVVEYGWLYLTLLWYNVIIASSFKSDSASDTQVRPIYYQTGRESGPGGGDSDPKLCDGSTLLDMDVQKLTCLTWWLCQRLLHVTGSREGIQSTGEPLATAEAGFSTARLPFMSSNQQCQSIERTMEYECKRK